MQILLTNDDGIFAPGLAAIYKELIKLGDVTVVAPMDSRSGASHSVTVAKPLVCNKVDIDGQFTGFSVQGSPADCVKLACMQLHDGPMDLLVAGINNGANVGINVYYSGTVAAAMEAAFFKIPAVAMSLAAEEQMDFEKAASYCTQILRRLIPLRLGPATACSTVASEPTPKRVPIKGGPSTGFDPSTLLRTDRLTTGLLRAGDVININIPLLSRGKPKGIRVVPQSTSGFHEYYTPVENEQSQPAFQLSGGPHRSEEIPADTTSLAEGFITITPLVPDMTNHQKIRELQQIKW